MLQNKLKHVHFVKVTMMSSFFHLPVMFPGNFRIKGEGMFSLANILQVAVVIHQVAFLLLLLYLGENVKKKSHFHV